MDKLNIAVIFGGCSSEYGVSLESSHSVIVNMDRERFNPVMVGITREGRWLRFDGDPEKIASDTWQEDASCRPAAISPDRGAGKLITFYGNLTEEIRLDAAFPVLHGRNGEDGTVQGLIELAGIPLVGCGVLASALCMDKDRAHKLAHAAGVSVPQAFTLRGLDEMGRCAALADQIGYPLFVKPVKAGSSFGITKVARRWELEDAVRHAFEFDDQVIVEEAIEGFECGCAVMGNGELTVGEVDEIEIQGDLFDFTEKYNLITSKIHVPARVSPEDAARLKETAKVIYTVLDCRGFARVDMFLEPGGRIVFNEVNTIPGFTAHSRYPSMMKAAGLSFKQVITGVIELAVGR